MNPLIRMVGVLIDDRLDHRDMSKRNKKFVTNTAREEKRFVTNPAPTIFHPLFLGWPQSNQ